jgi:5-methylcytosine-specific restriction enzyme subunit McrC
MTARQHVVIKEYAYLVCDGANSTITGSRISKDAFDELTQLINDSPSEDENDYGTIFWQRGQRLQARHFVGVIQTSDGTQIEILPKIAETDEKISKEDKDKENANLKRILIKMLREVGNLPFKTGQLATQEISDNFPLLEFFIRDFLQCVDAIVKRGIRSDYVRQEDNLPFMKGKILINQQIKYNTVRRERFYVEFDSFEANRPENRLIKSSLQKVLKITREYSNQRLARELLFMFDDVPFSTEYKQDFQKCSKDRGMHYYQDSLDWCRLILKDESPVPTAGQKTFRSFLFPMPQLFEKYVEIKLRQKLKAGFSLKSQAREKYLCTHSNQGIFQLKPDLLIKGNGTTFVLDAKWKRISGDKSRDNYGISQSDFYQMFAYGHKYLGGEGELFLIYPKTDKFDNYLKPFDFNENKTSKLTLWTVPFDLGNDELLLPTDFDFL